MILLVSYLHYFVFLCAAWHYEPIYLYFCAPKLPISTTVKCTNFKNELQGQKRSDRPDSFFFSPWHRNMIRKCSNHKFPMIIGKAVVYPTTVSLDTPTKSILSITWSIFGPIDSFLLSNITLIVP